MIMSEFQAFIFYSFPFFLGGIVIRVACWTLGCALYFLNKGLGDDNS